MDLLRLFALIVGLVVNFKKTCVKGSHDILVENRGTRAKSIVFKDLFEHKGFFFKEKIMKKCTPPVPPKKK